MKIFNILGSIMGMVAMAIVVYLLVVHLKDKKVQASIELSEEELPREGE